MAAQERPGASAAGGGRGPGRTESAWDTGLSIQKVTAKYELPQRRRKIGGSEPSTSSSVTGPSLAYSQGLVTFIIGKGDARKTFQVHKEIAVSHSPFFKAAFEGNFQEGHTQTMRLDDVDGHIFRMVVHWLYTHKIDNAMFRYSSVVTSSSKLWVLAGRCLLPVLQNECMRTMLCEIRGSPLLYLYNLMGYAYGASESDTLMQLAAVLAAFGITTAEYGENCKNFPARLVLDASMKMKQCVWSGQDLNARDFMLKDANGEVIGVYIEAEAEAEEVGGEN